MARVLDLNSVQASFLDLTLRDPARTVVHLDLPIEALVSELEGIGPELKQMEKGDRAGVAQIYDLAARLINHNFDGFTCTGDQLQREYGMHLMATLTFLSAYMDAIKDLTNEKN